MAYKIKGRSRLRLDGKTFLLRSLVCPGKKSGEAVRTALQDFQRDQTYSENCGHDFTLHGTFDQIKPKSCTLGHSRRPRTRIHPAASARACRCPTSRAQAELSLMCHDGCGHRREPDPA